MKAAIIDRYGSPDEFRYGDIEDPRPGDGEVVIDVAAAGINPVDLLDRAGGTKEWRQLAFPAVIGWDVSGTVSGIGKGVTAFRAGDRVMAWAFATYAEKVAIRTDLLVKVPDEMDLVDAAALPLAPMTGSQLITRASGVVPGQTVLVSGAVGAVGRAAVFAAKDKGARVIAAVRGSQMIEASTLDADAAVALDDEAALSAIGPVDIVANTVRGAAADRLLALVRRGGTFASVTGAPDNASSRPDVRTVAFVSKQDADDLSYVCEAVRSGRLVIPVTHRLPLAQAADAHRMMAAGGAGKILLLP